MRPPPRAGPRRRRGRRGRAHRRPGHAPNCRSAHKPDCVIDFSAPEGTMAILPVCVDRQIPLVVATTGHTADAEGRDRGRGPPDRRAVRPEHEPRRQPAVQARRDWRPRRSRARASTWRSSSGTTASRRTRRAARRCTSPRSSRRCRAAHFVHGREGMVGERTAGRDRHPRRPRRRQRRRAHDHLHHARRDAGTRPQGAQPRQLRPRGACWRRSSSPNRPAGRYTMDDVLGL